MTEKFFSYDVIRAIAIVLIISCHYCLFSGLNTTIGGLLGGAGNILFFTLSALLFGLKWNQTSQRPYCRLWIRRRLIRISSSLYPFLLILVVFFIGWGIPFDWRDVFLNFIYLGWFAKLPGNGHLWFLTLLFACYILFFVVSRYKGVKSKKLRWIWILLFVISLCALFFADCLRIPGYPFLILFFALISFIFADDILARIKQFNPIFAIVQFVIIGSTILCLFYFYDFYRLLRPVAELLYDIFGLSLLLLLLCINYKKELPIVSYISSISFELYLVHHTLCAGPFIKISTLSLSHFVRFVLLVGISLVLASVFHIISSLLNKLLSKYYTAQ